MFGFKKKDDTPKKKQKMVFAKSKKEVVIMVAVWALFLGNTAYMIYKYALDNIQISTPVSVQEPMPGLETKK